MKKQDVLATRALVYSPQAIVAFHEHTAITPGLGDNSLGTAVVASHRFMRGRLSNDDRSTVPGRFGRIVHRLPAGPEKQKPSPYRVS